jgi:hypothetical protein
MFESGAQSVACAVGEIMRRETTQIPPRKAVRLTSRSLARRYESRPVGKQYAGEGPFTKQAVPVGKLYCNAFSMN